MKRTVGLIIILAVVLCFFSGCDKQAENIYGEALQYPETSQFGSTGSEGIFDYIRFEDHAKITGCNVAADEKEVVFPSEVEGIPVKEIGGGILRGNTVITSVTVPDSVEVIGNYAFSECTSLTEMNLSANLKKVGCGAFDDTVWFDSVSDEFVSVGLGVLIKYNGEESEVTVPENIGYLSDAFAGNEFITVLVIPETVKGISDNAFLDCSSLGEIEMPKTLTDIGYGAFEGTTWLAVNHDEFVSVGDSVLIKYTGNAESVAVPDGIKFIAGAFYGNENVRSVTVPASVQFVRYGTFLGCTGLESVDFEGAYTKLDQSLFGNCEKLQTVKLPQNLTVIPDYLFYSCKALCEIVIPNSVKYIGRMAFYYCENLVETEFPKELTTLGTGSFFGCTRLEKAELPQSVERIGALSFGCCYSLSAVSIPPKVTVIEGGTFSYCNKLKAVTVPETVNEISEYAFEGSEDITVNIQGTDTVIVVNAFGETENRVKLICPKDSAAREFAEKNNIEYTIE